MSNTSGEGQERLLADCGKVLFRTTASVKPAHGGDAKPLA
jgi:hypothetical protein